MLKSIKRKSLQMSAGFTAGTMATGPAFATSGAGGGAADVSTIASNITQSISSLPGLLTALCYIFGILLIVLGILKVKDHVENPGNSPLKDGAIRLCVGGFLLACPIMFAAMRETINGGIKDNASTAVLNKISFAVQ